MADIMRLSPSRTAIKRAAELGQEMARKERHCRPNMAMAEHYETYLRYRNAQREIMENSDVFAQRWVERLLTIADKDGRAHGLRMDDSMASWDIWYNKLVLPLKEVFWLAWEQTWKLPEHYAEARQHFAGMVQPPPVLQVAARRAAAQPPAPDLTQVAMAQAFPTKDQPLERESDVQLQATDEDGHAVPWGMLAAMKPSAYNQSNPAA